jgi:hypothetical protein
MPFNISTFVSNISDNGYLKNNKFSVSVLPPRILSRNNLSSVNNTSDAIDMIRFRADSIKAPGITILNTDVNRYGVGPTQKQPYSANFSENNISFVCDRESALWQFWYQWTRSIFEFAGTDNAGFTAEANQIPRYFTEYKENYSTTIQIEIYDEMGEVSQTINMFQAFPTAISDIPLSWGDGNLLKINVTIAFTDYTIAGSGVSPQQLYPISVGAIVNSLTIPR